MMHYAQLPHFAVVHSKSCLPTSGGK